jgi:hypothetical protein
MRETTKFQSIIKIATGFQVGVLGQKKTRKKCALTAGNVTTEILQNIAIKKCTVCADRPATLAFTDRLHRLNVKHVRKADSLIRLESYNSVPLQFHAKNVPLDGDKKTTQRNARSAQRETMLIKLRE